MVQLMGVGQIQEQYMFLAMFEFKNRHNVPSSWRKYLKLLGLSLALIITLSVKAAWADEGKTSSYEWKHSWNMYLLGRGGLLGFGYTNGISRHWALELGAGLLPVVAVAYTEVYVGVTPMASIGPSYNLTPSRPIGLNLKTSFVMILLEFEWSPGIYLTFGPDFMITRRVALGVEVGWYSSFAQLFRMYTKEVGIPWGGISLRFISEGIIGRK